MKQTLHTNSAAYLLLCIIAACTFQSCRYGISEALNRGYEVSKRSTTITDIPTPIYAEGADSYTCVILTDVHYGADKSRPDDRFLTWLDEKKTKPAFCLVLGDMAEHGEKSEFEQYKAFADKIEERKVPVYGVVGNHDLYKTGWRYWKTYVKPYNSYYRFYTQNFAWYFLDSGNGTLGEPQLQNMIREMQADPRPKLVFTHYPVYGGGIFYFALSDTKERALLIDTFARNNVKTVFTGHYHPGKPPFNFGSFSELVVKGFLDNAAWIELHVDETNAAVSWTEYGRN
ncbi:metallophosphoesterase family protein [Treponema brennaborense]|uniref:Metallophosphoesterase n=1 Tax=Treponema brennaborense (strain DSM 12168 / CIP 105900 / DD5/3) TaxID=906968 RepID=F4LKK0_TREBD|nr:metallophosphoesterase [Treponema brennaborense]AEE17556.1 metallophosphoesterase [Treponema brennaborense DSM 12168]